MDILLFQLDRRAYAAEPLALDKEYVPWSVCGGWGPGHSIEPLFASGRDCNGRACSSHHWDRGTAAHFKVSKVDGMLRARVADFGLARRPLHLRTSLFLLVQ